MTDDYRTQQGRILSLLQSRESVSLPDILDLRIANYRARISELRQQGHQILCETTEVGKIRHSCYRLVRQPRQESLFGERHEANHSLVS